MDLTRKPPVIDSLLDRFVVRTGIFGYQLHASHNDWRQMSGCYGKTVFTDKEFKLVQQEFGKCRRRETAAG